MSGQVAFKSTAIIAGSPILGLAPLATLRLGPLYLLPAAVAAFSPFGYCSFRL